MVETAGQALDAVPVGTDSLVGSLVWPGATSTPRTGSSTSRTPSTASPTRGWSLPECLSAVHSSSRSLLPVVVDVGVLTNVALAVGIRPWWAAPTWAAACVAAGYLGGVYADRDSLQSRGVLWYPGRVLLPLVLVAFAATAGHRVVGMVAAELVAAGVTALVAVRMLAWLFLASLRRQGKGLRRAMVVGSGPAADRVWRRLLEFPEGGLLPVVRIPTSSLSGRVLSARVRADGIEHVVIVPADGEDLTAASDLRSCVGLTPWFSLVPPLAELFLQPQRLTELGGVPFISLGRVLRGRAGFPGKRLFDVAFAALLLLLVAPVLLVAAIAVKACDGGPVLFRQRRVGRDGEIFRMLKFRSMVVGADRMQADLAAYNISDGLLFRMAADPRVTAVGRVLRRLSLDELPQLWNVLRGEMSLVGPRPLPVSPTAFLEPDRERHSVLPGITGYWQISGGNGLSYDEMVKLDLAYIRNWSLWLDIRLLLRTLPVLLHRHDPS